jgi:hypothetical protein
MVELKIMQTIGTSSPFIYGTGEEKVFRYQPNLITQMTSQHRPSQSMMLRGEPPMFFPFVG